MATIPYAKVRATLDGGAPATGYIAATTGQVCQLSIENPSGVTSYKWEITDYPPDYPLPSGWIEASDGTYFSYASTPPTFTISDWGKYTTALTIQGRLSSDPVRWYDASMMIEAVHASGVSDISYLEAQQKSLRGWTYDFRKAIRVFVNGVAEGTTTWLGLTDTPGSFGSQKRKTTAVNAAENALAFYEFSEVCGTLANLKAITPITGARYTSKCHTTLGDGGGGEWRGVSGASSGTYVDNGFTIIRPTGGDGSAAFLRENVTYLRPEWGGAVGDNSTNDRVVLASAIAVSVALGVELVLSKQHVIDVGIDISGLSNLRIRGEGQAQIRITGTNKTILYGTTALTRPSFSDFILVGNNTEEGGFGATGGGGIHLQNSSGIRTRNITLKNFGKSGSSPVSTAVGLWFWNCDGVINTKTVGDSSNNGLSSGEVWYTSCRDTLNDGHASDGGAGGTNVCLGYESAGGALVNTSYNHKVTGGSFKRGVGTTARHGILANYGGSPTGITITGNTFEGFCWCAVYHNSGNAQLGPKKTGGAVISNNIIRYCGGLVSSLSAAIFYSGTAGAEINGNIITDTGLDADGTPRAMADEVPAIKVIGPARNVDVSHNTIAGSAGYGIFVWALGGQVYDVTLAHNTIFDTEGFPLWILSEFNPVAWAPGTVYAPEDVNVVVANGGNFYAIITPGTTAGSGGPTGTGYAITDGSCVWSYVGTGPGINHVDLVKNKAYTGTRNIPALRINASGGATLNNINCSDKYRSECNQATATAAWGIHATEAFDGTLEPDIEGFNYAMVLVGTHRSIRPMVSPRARLHNNQAGIGLTGGVQFRPVEATFTGTTNPVTDGARQGGKQIAHYSSGSPFEWISDNTLGDAQYYKGDQSKLGRNQHLGRAGYHGIADGTTWAGTMAPYYMDVPMRFWEGDDTVANTETVVQTLSEIDLTAGQLYEVTWRFRVELATANTWAIGKYTAYILRGSTGGAAVAGEGYVGGSAPAGWTIDVDISSASPRITLTNGTGQTRAAWVEPTARLMTAGAAVTL